MKSRCFIYFICAKQFYDFLYFSFILLVTCGLFFWFFEKKPLENTNYKPLEFFSIEFKTSSDDFFVANSAAEHS